jgi:hypothetical protein
MYPDFGINFKKKSSQFSGSPSFIAKDDPWV